MPDVLQEAEQLRRKSEKPAKAPRWAPANPAHIQVDIEDAIATRVRVLAVLNKQTVSQVVNLLLEQALNARGSF